MFKTFFLTICVLLLAGCARQRLVVVTAKPQFIQENEWVNLVLRDAGQEYKVGWGMGTNVHFVPVPLNTNETYTFTISQQSTDDVWFSELQKVQQDGRLVYDVGICEVHHAPMQKKKVRIVYGLVEPSPGEPSFEIDAQLFPHRWEVSFGGCVDSFFSPRTEKIYVCSECKKAYQQWKVEHSASK